MTTELFTLIGVIVIFLLLVLLNSKEAKRKGGLKPYLLGTFITSILPLLTTHIVYTIVCRDNYPGTMCGPGWKVLDIAVWVLPLLLLGYQFYYFLRLRKLY